MEDTKHTLRHAIDSCAAAERELLSAKDRLRIAVRSHLRAVTEERGSLGELSKKLGISSTALANVKSGFSPPSWRAAEKLLRATDSGASGPDGTRRKGKK